MISLFFCSISPRLCLLLPPLTLSLHLPPPPTGTSGFYRRTGLPAGDHELRVVAVDPVRNERTVIRNRLQVCAASTFCVVVGTNAALTVGRNNNVTVEFTGTGLTTGFQCIMDRREPYFNFKRHAVIVMNSNVLVHSHASHLIY